MKPEMNYSLYLVTDRGRIHTATLEEAVEQAIKGGCTVVQLREKELSSLDFYHCARRVKAVTDHYHIPLIVNDRLDIALAVDAQGLHVGQGDLPAKVVRNIMGHDKILGVSVSSLAEAVQAEKDGADYLGVGAMFATATKTDAKLVSLKSLREIKRASSRPIVVIGGMNKDTIPLVTGMGVDGIAVVSAILSEADIREASARLLRISESAYDR